MSLRLQKNRFQVLRQDPPWKVVRAFRQPRGETLIHLNNVSGGVLAGDRLALEVVVEAGAAAQITTTGATRLYRHRAGACDSEQTATFWIGEKARLEYLPDPLIPYAQSRHAQRTAIHLATGASLFWWETLAPGRKAAGEVFAFERLHISSEIRVRDQPVLLENFLLEPWTRRLDVTARMREYTYLASLYVCQQGKPGAFWRRLEDQMAEAARARTRPGEAIWAASALASDGVIVRGLSSSNRLIPAAFLDFWRLARLSMTGEEPAFPRKIY
ncbi:MAG TPA: urease accessory protein UreD [Bryobacteraceae bacterium]|nr:urease accessory protein UreD [Bryobacteraceae bacterium]